MTGRDLIVYILQNNLEDELVFENGLFNGKLIGFISEDEAATQLNVGNATVQAWADLNWVESLRINDKLFVKL